MKQIFMIVLIIGCTGNLFSQSTYAAPEYYRMVGYKDSIYNDKLHEWKFIRYYKDKILESIVILDSAFRKKREEVYFFNGSLLYSISFNGTTFFISDCGDIEGPFIEYYDSIKVKRRGYYFNSIRSGLWTEYFENGNKKSEGRYILSKKDSICDTGQKYLDELKKRIHNDTITYGMDFIQRDTTYTLESGTRKMNIRSDTLSRKDVRMTYLSPKNGDWKYWNESGILIKDEHYKEGKQLRRRGSKN